MRFLLIQGMGFLGTILYLISVKIIKHCFGFNLFPVFLCPTVIDKSTMFTLTLDKYQSMNDNVGQLGFTKAALYKYYSSKQGILDKIVEQMNRMDYERDAEYEMPETEPDGFAEALKLCNKHGESQVMIDEIYPYNKRKHR